MQLKFNNLKICQSKFAIDCLITFHRYNSSFCHITLLNYRHRRWCNRFSKQDDAIWEIEINHRFYFALTAALRVCKLFYLRLSDAIGHLISQSICQQISDNDEFFQPYHTLVMRIIAGFFGVFGDGVLDH